jgi:lysophospholipase L1-like esterase
MKIIFLGDSLTQGTLGASYVNKAAAIMPGQHFINQGVNGDTSLNLFRRVERDVIAAKPDGVFIMIGVNDSVSSVDSAGRPYFRFAKRIPGGQISPISFRENMRALLGKLTVVHTKIWVALPPIEYNLAQVKRLRQINAYTVEICRDMNIPVLDLMATMTPPEILDRPSYGVLTYANNLWRVIFAQDKDRLRAAGNYTYSFDGIHLTDAGAQQMADLIMPFLRANGVS